MKAKASEYQSIEEQAAKKEFIFINGKPWPWNCYLWKGREERRLPLRMYTKVIGIYFTDWVRKLFR